MSIKPCYTKVLVSYAETNPENKWFFGCNIFTLEPYKGIWNAELSKIAQSPVLADTLAFVGHTLVDMDGNESKDASFRISFAVEAQTCDEALGKGAEKIWKLYEIESMSGIIGKVLLRQNNLIIDCTKAYHKLDETRGTFYTQD